MRIITKLLTVFSIAAALPLAGCKSVPSEANAQEQAKAKRIPVGVFEPEVRKFKHSVVVQGNLLPNRKAVITPEVPGKILRIYKKEGDSVREGESLVLLSQSDFKLGEDASQASLVQAQTNYDTMKVQYNRFKKLFETKAIPRAEFEKIESGYKMAEAQLKMAKTGLAVASSRLSDTLVRSPFEGFVTARMMDEGEVVRAMPPSVVMVVMDTDPLKAEGAVNEFDAFKVKVGTPAEVTVGALPDERFKGEVEMVNAAVDPRTRTVKIRVKVPNADLRLKPGMTATIAIHLGETEALAVPDDVIIRTDVVAKKGTVFTVNDNTAHKKEVIYGNRQDDLIEIRKGLNPGDLVVRGGQQSLSDGQQVLVVAENEEG